MKIIGVTKCPTGIAHTYMAAERLELMAPQLGHQIKIETQGSQGTENRLTEKDIREADYVILAADVAVDEVERFYGKKMFCTPIKPVLRNTKKIFEELETKSMVFEAPEMNHLEQGFAFGGDMAEQSELIKQLMNGASHMIPFVVVGGMFISMAMAFGGESSMGTLTISSSFWSKINEIGELAFTLMYPILAGFLAFSIAGRATLAPAMIGAMIATDGELLGTGQSTGFLGCIVVGYLVGYMVKWMNNWKIPRAVRPMMTIFVIPLSGVAMIAFLFLRVLGRPITFVMQGLNGLLVHLSASPSTAVLLGLVLGAMIGVDMGGPINKAAFFFGVASIAEGNPQIMGIASSAIAVAPLSMGLAAILSKKKFSEEEQRAGIYTILMGMIGISEGAIPFAVADPRNVIPSVVVGSAVSGAAAAVLGITSVVPHGGPIVGVLGAVNDIFLYFFCILEGVAVSTMLVLLLKKEYTHKESE